jgi:oligopeptide/dipeptide ABC transporter ATP-binding protein
VLQEPGTSLNPVYPVGEQIAEVLRHHRGMNRQEARRGAVRLLEEVRIPDAEARAAAYPHQLSGGMQQRVMLAAALACDPMLLVADEPTTALDVTVQANILALLGRLRRERGMAMIFITHDLALVPNLADRLYVLYAGVIVEEGPAAAVLGAPAHPYTRALVGALPELWPEGGPPAAEGPRAPLADDPWRGCPYRHLCPHARPRCRESFPVWVRIDPEWRAACLTEVAPVLAGRRLAP